MQIDNDRIKRCPYFSQSQTVPNTLTFENNSPVFQLRLTCRCYVFGKCNPGQGSLCIKRLTPYQRFLAICYLGRQYLFFSVDPLHRQLQRHRIQRDQHSTFRYPLTRSDFYC